MSEHTRIPLCEPCMAGGEWANLKTCVETNYVSSAGPFVDEFEERVCGITGAKHAVAVVNGTSALHLALIVAGVERGDEVLIPALTFVAPANAVSYVGANPVFIDVESQHGQLDVDLVRDFLAHECECQDGVLKNRKSGRRVKAILPVHILGHPVDLDPLMEIATQYGLVLVEDAAEALGARYGGRPIGGHGDVICFSFNGNKVVTAGGGGVVVTSNDEWALRARHLSTQARASREEYLHDEVGFNYRLTNIQAAVGCAQLEVLHKFIEKKRIIAKRYFEAFSDISDLLLPSEKGNVFSTYWLYTVRCVGSDVKGARELKATLADQSIEARLLWRPMHLIEAHGEHQIIGGEIAEAIYEESLSLPSSVGLKEQEQNRVIETVRTFFASS